MTYNTETTFMADGRVSITVHYVCDSDSTKNVELLSNTYKTHYVANTVATQKINKHRKVLTSIK